MRLAQGLAEVPLTTANTLKVNHQVAAILARLLIQRVECPEREAAALEHIAAAFGEPAATMYRQAAAFIRDQVAILDSVDRGFPGWSA